MSIEVTDVVQWPPLTSKMEVISEYALLHMWGVYSEVFGDAESEFEVRLKIQGIFEVIEAVQGH